MLYAGKSGYGVRAEDKLLEMMAIPIRVRAEMVYRIANNQSVYTVEQYSDWYQSRPLSDEHYDWALAEWKQEFPMQSHTREKINAWIKDDSRASKKQARDLRNSSFKAFLQQECVNTQLAFKLLKYPTAMVDTLLESWAEYLESPEYREEKARSQKVDINNIEAMNEKQRQFELKVRVQKLRSQVRYCNALNRHPKNIKDKDRELYQQWSSGHLAKELDKLTIAYGYGKMSSGEIIGKKGFRGPRGY